LRLEDYVELLCSAERTAVHLQAQLLQGFGFDEPACLEEVRRWQQQFISFPESRQRFEQLMSARRSYGP
jgi:3-deoxy-D-arabino-heptulosonate 7-phosphate (DAHP) synthase class II